MNNMLFIKWHEKYDLGIPILDEQHRGIVSIINALYHLMKNGLVSNKLYLSVLETIKSYANVHFIIEEELMLSCGYLKLEKHRETHKKFIAEMERMRRSDGQEDFTVAGTKPLMDFLKIWWLEHINEEDRLYGPQLLANLGGANGASHA